MAGHSKWANIRHRKSRQDAKRGKIFTKIIREITIAARGGESPEDNPRLRSAVAKALAANMTKDTIDRAIAKGAGTGDNDNLEEITYEGYGPGGVAVLVESMTDNKNRTVAEVRHALTKFGGNLGSSGSVNYLFERKGEIYLPVKDESAEEKILELALETGAADVQQQNNECVVTTTPETFAKVCTALEENGFQPTQSEISMIATTEVEVDQSAAQSILKMLDMLEDLDDTQNVYHNASISDEVLAALNQEQ